MLQQFQNCLLMRAQGNDLGVDFKQPMLKHFECIST